MEYPYLTIAPSLARQAGAVGTATLLELAALAVALGTWPKVPRDLCSPARLAPALRCAESDISAAIKRVIQLGYARPTSDRESLVLSGTHFLLAQPAEDIELSSAHEQVAQAFKSGSAISPSQAAGMNGDSSVQRHVSYSSTCRTRELENERTREREDLELVAPSTSSTRGRPSKARPHEAQIFHLWRKLFSKRASTKLDAKRLKAIRRALYAEPKGFGFSLGEVESCIKGWAILCQDNDWRMEQLNRHELALFLRDAAHVEEGLSAFDAAGRPEPGPTGFKGATSPFVQQVQREMAERRRQAERRDW